MAMRDFLVGGATSFVAGDHLLGDSVVLMEASLSGYSRCSDLSQKVPVF